jgi:hypothetical protein
LDRVKVCARPSSFSLTEEKDERAVLSLLLLGESGRDIFALRRAERSK